MKLRQIGQIRLEEIRDKAVRSYFRLIVCSLWALAAAGLAKAIWDVCKRPNGNRNLGLDLGLTALALYWLFFVRGRKRVLDRKALKEPRTKKPTPGPVPPLTLTDFEPPDAGIWSSGRVEFSTGIAASDRWCWAVSIWLISGLITWAILSLSRLGEDGASSLYRTGVALLFFLLCGGSLVWAVLGTRRYRKTGTSVFQMTAGPGVIGGEFSGLLEVPATIPLKNGFQAELICLRQDAEGNCALERTIPHAGSLVIREAATLRRRLEIPVRFSVPADAVETTRGEAEEFVRWILVLRANGTDYQAEFDVPIFKTRGKRR